MAYINIYKPQGDSSYMNIVKSKGYSYSLSKKEKIETST